MVKVDRVLLENGRGMGNGERDGAMVGEKEGVVNLLVG
jgi:hypothetical protein